MLNQSRSSVYSRQSIMMHVPRRQTGFALLCLALPCLALLCSALLAVWRSPLTSARAKPTQSTWQGQQIHNNPRQGSGIPGFQDSRIPGVLSWVHMGRTCGWGRLRHIRHIFDFLRVSLSRNHQSAVRQGQGGGNASGVRSPDTLLGSCIALSRSS